MICSKHDTHRIKNMIVLDKFSMCKSLLLEPYLHEIGLLI
jgi:hypothetical protein